MENGKYLNKLILTVKFLEELNMLPANANLTQTEFRLIREIVVEREAGNQIISSEYYPFCSFPARYKTRKARDRQAYGISHGP